MNGDKIGIGVIGYGYWGPNLARNLQESSDCRLVAVCDLKEGRRKLAAVRHPPAIVYSSYEELLSDPKVQAVAIATPVSLHHDVAMAALCAGKDVLVEKPLAGSVREAHSMIDAAEKYGRILMVGHTFIYTSAVRKMRGLVQGGDLGQLYYYDSVRINLGLIQPDVDVLWDLAVHDLAIMDFVLGRQPAAVSAIGVHPVTGSGCEVAYLTLLYDDSLIGHIHVNWLAPSKVRRTLLGGSNKMVIYDDVEPSEKIKVYDKGVDRASDPENKYQLLVSYRSGDMHAPRLDAVEALNVEVAHFAECITRRSQPLTDGYAGLRVVQILELASESLRNRGALQFVNGREVLK